MSDDVWGESPLIQKERAEYYEKGFKHQLAEVISQRVAKKIAQGIEQGTDQGMAEEIAESVIHGIEEGIEQGELKNAQRTLVMFVRTKFPDLAGLAGQHAVDCLNLDTLENVTQQLFTTSDHQAARELIESI